METPVKSHGLCGPTDLAGLEVRLLGPLTLRRDGVALALPASRKVRGLFGYLALAPHPVTRSELCDLLWDLPDDPRGELRWCLSKIRGLVDGPGPGRIVTSGDSVRLDLSGCCVDAFAIGQAVTAGLGALSEERLRRLSALFAGEFLAGLEIQRSPVFDTWLAAQRRRFRGCRVAVLEHLARIAPGEASFPALEDWLRHAPFDVRAHAALLHALAERGRMQDGEEHLRATAGLFETEGLDPGPLRALWRAEMAQARSGATRARAEAPAPPAAAESERAVDRATSPNRASVAVMPFAGPSSEIDFPGRIGDGLVRDVITRLAKLRTLSVIAEGSAFALSARQVAPQEAARMLSVDYVVSGTARRRGNRLAVSVELTETRSARIVWTEVYDLASDDTFLILDDIGNRIVAAVASEIETAERNHAVLKPPNSLTAWEAHHRGLWHMYRFNRADNERALHFFQTAVALDPTFSRAHAGVSFAHFQNAFQGWKERGAEIDRSFAAAGQSLMADDRDPAAHWAMGRALWLRGQQPQSLVELETAIELSPNFALGHYTLAFIHSQGGDPAAAIAFSDHSRRLSPFDPLLFGMLGARAMALLRLGRFDEAADWALRACARPNAHVHILAIAAYSLALAGRLDEARAQFSAVRTTVPRYGVEDFLTAMQFSADDQAVFRQAARRL